MVHRSPSTYPINPEKSGASAGWPVGGSGGAAGRVRRAVCGSRGAAGRVRRVGRVGGLGASGGSDPELIRRFLGAGGQAGRVSSRWRGQFVLDVLAHHGHRLKNIHYRRLMSDSCLVKPPDLGLSIAVRNYLDAGRNFLCEPPEWFRWRTH